MAINTDELDLFKWLVASGADLDFRFPDNENLVSKCINKHRFSMLSILSYFGTHNVAGYDNLWQFVLNFTSQGSYSCLVEVASQTKDLFTPFYRQVFKPNSPIDSFYHDQVDIIISSELCERMKRPRFDWTA